MTDIVYPFGVNPLAESTRFMHEDLAKSGLLPTDFPIAPEPMPAYDGCACYKMWYTKDYFKLRINRAEDKYVGIKGMQPPVVPLGFRGEYTEEPLIASVEGLKKALLFQKTTGIPTLAIDSCWGFGELGNANDPAQLKDLHSDILVRLSPLQSHIVIFDGDWETNENVKLGLATYKTLLEEHTTKLKFKNLSSVGGYDDWFVGKYGADRTIWPDSGSVIETVLGGLPDIDPKELVGCPLSFALGNESRFNKAYLDLTHRGAATLLIQLIGVGNFYYCKDIGEWVVWDKVKLQWERLGNMSYQLANPSAMYYYSRAQICEIQAARMDGHTALAEKAVGLRKQAHAYTKFAQAHCSSTPGRAAILKDLSGRPEVVNTIDAFDSNPDLLGVANGVVDLRDGKLYPVSQSNMVLRKAPWPYTEEEPLGPDGGKTVERIKKFLWEITAPVHGVRDETTYDWLHRRLGAALRGENSLSAFELWVGGGANGKTVLSNLIQGALSASNGSGYATSTNADVLMSTMKTRDAESSTPFLVKLLGMRIVFMAETKDTQYMNEALVKKITGDDAITVRANYQDAQVHNVTFTPFLLTNSLPNIAEGDGAIWDRLVPTRFACRWLRPNAASNLREEDVGLPEADPWFQFEAKRDPVVLRWILWWMVQGSVEWERNRILDRDNAAVATDLGFKSKSIRGLVQPRRVVEEIEAYREKNDTLQDWLTDCNWTVSGEEGDVVPSAILYQSFRQFMLDVGHSPVSAKVFSQRLIGRFPGLINKVVRLDGKTVRCYVGIKRAV